METKREYIDPQDIVYSYNKIFCRQLQKEGNAAQKARKKSACNLINIRFASLANLSINEAL